MHSTWNAINWSHIFSHTICRFQAFFEGALDTDRIIPPRYLVHRLLDALAQVGRSADAFHVYRRMKEIGMPLTQATYSRLFKWVSWMHVAKSCSFMMARSELNKVAEKGQTYVRMDLTFSLKFDYREFVAQTIFYNLILFMVEDCP